LKIYLKTISAVTTV